MAKDVDIWKDGAIHIRKATQLTIDNAAQFVLDGSIYDVFG